MSICLELTLFLLNIQVISSNIYILLNGESFKSGALGEIRTHDLCLRRATLYPTELQALRFDYILFDLKKQGDFLILNELTFEFSELYLELHSNI